MVVIIELAKVKFGSWYLLKTTFVITVYLLVAKYYG